MANKPIAVLISDVHYSVPTLEIADACMRMAIEKSNELKVPLIVAGDLHDTKANLRAECVNRMLETFKLAHTKPIVIRGNHCSVNEKSNESALQFLESWAYLHTDGIMGPCDSLNSLYLCPYYHDAQELKFLLSTVTEGATIIMHQGIEGSDSGEYIQDHSALNHEDVADFRVISGHYHRRQDIKTGRPRKGAVGLFSYIGNPYTLNFGEADHPEKGFQILMDDGMLEFVPTNQRKHIIYDISKHSALIFKHTKNDIIRVRYTGTREELGSITKEKIASDLAIQQNFKLELIPTESTSAESKPTASGPELFDQVIDASQQISPEGKNRLKTLWKRLKEA